MPHIKCDLVAIMDADDISKNIRFQRQINFFKNNPETDVVGGVYEEFKNVPGDMRILRKVPLQHHEIVLASKKYQPVNNVTAMFRTKAAISVGGYSGGRGTQEDYILWVKMMLAGYKFANMDEVLVDVRVGNDMMERRGGVDYLYNEIKTQILFFKLGHIKIFRLAVNILIRIIVRLMPKGIRKYIYFLVGDLAKTINHFKHILQIQKFNFGEYFYIFFNNKLLK